MRILLVVFWSTDIFETLSALNDIRIPMCQKAFNSITIVSYAVRLGYFFPALFILKGVLFWNVLTK